MIRQFIRLIRPHQWLKNTFVLIGLVFGHHWSDPDMVYRVLLALLAFCLSSSAVYVFNDIADAESDRRHATKRNRPIASGAIRPGTAVAAGTLLAIAGVSLALAASVLALAAVVAYMLLNVLYMLRLKRMVIVDVFAISAGFMLRILVGTVGVGIPPSSWLLLCGLMMTLFLGFAKRRSELQVSQAEGNTRAVLHHYRPDVLEQFLSISATCSVLSYALYTVSPDTVATHGTDKLIYTVPFIVYAIFRYLYLLHGKGKGEDFAHDLIADRHMLFAIAGWMAVTFAILANGGG